MKTIILKFTRMIMVFVTMIILNCGNATCQTFDIAHTISDGAQGNTIAFDGLAFLTGNFCACSFIPPGKVADFFGFQYLRDNDITHMGHTTDFNTVIANNLLYVLDSAQKAQIIALATTQVSIINQYAYNRFPLIDAFIRMRDSTMPVGSLGLDSNVVKNYSSQLYRIDGRISIQRAQLYSNIIKSLNAWQKNYLDSIKVLGEGNMPVLPDQIDKTPLNNNQFVGVMSIAGDIFSWYAGSVTSDVYFCPERQGDYFGGFYIKDAPAMGVHGYSIDTSLTQTGGIRFLNSLTPTQALLITSIVDSQRTSLYSIVDRRTDISNLLRGLLTNNNIDTTTVLNLCETYGKLDGEISYFYATYFSKVGWSLSTIQRDTLDSIRNLNNYPCVGAYLYSDSIGVPNIINTDFFFLNGNGINEFSTNSKYNINIYPNPATDKLTIVSLQKSTIEILNLQGQIIETLIAKTNKTTIDISDFARGMYFIKVTTDKGVMIKKFIKE